MTAASAHWLRLRETADANARSTTLTAMLAGALHGPLRVADLGAGTGANARYLAPRLAGPQSWRLFDQDADLLARARRECSTLHAADGRAVTVATVTQDLADRDVLDFAGVDLVCGSALLDLVGPEWVASVVGGVRRAGASALFTLSYDGRIAWCPVDADDDAVRAAFNAHQRDQCHFGEPALGPAAGDHAAARFSRAGFIVQRARSDWTLGPDRWGLLAALIDGWAAAASEQQPAEAERFRAWAGRRQAQAEDGTLHVVVGHLDFVALPGLRS